MARNAKRKRSRTEADAAYAARRSKRRWRTAGWLVAGCALLGALAWQAQTTNAPRAQIIGQVYDIEERDALEEILERVATTDWSKHINEDVAKDKVAKYRPKDLATLTKAPKNRTRMVDIQYSLEMDIPDGKGGIVYPKGYRYNALEYSYNPTIYVVFDPEDPAQIAWFESSPYRDDVRVRVLLTGGYYKDVSDRLQRPVYYLVQPIVERLQLEHVPCVFQQDTQMAKVRVTEYRLEDGHAPM